jgi:hypothetical protein
MAFSRKNKRQLAFGQLFSSATLLFVTGNWQGTAIPTLRSGFKTRILNLKKK